MKKEIEREKREERREREREKREERETEERGSPKAYKSVLNPSPKIK